MSRLSPPPVATRLEEWLQRADFSVRLSWYAATLLLLLISVFGWGVAPRTRLSLQNAVLLVVGGLGLVLFAVRPLARIRGVKLLQRRDFEICPRCRYNLKDLPKPGVCPECGRAFSRDELFDAWSAAYKKEHWLYG